MDVNKSSIPDEQDIKSIVDYEKITNKLENLTKSKKYNFLESLAEDSFKEIFELFATYLNEKSSLRKA